MIDAEACLDIELPEHADRSEPISEASATITVILPTRNRPELLAEAIASVLAQTIDGWEIVIVDSGSDPPATIPDDPRIRLVRLDGDPGPAGARNAGVDAAQGDVLAFLDDDDLFAPDRLAIGLDGLSRHPIAVCGTRFLHDTNGQHRRLEGDISETILDGLTPSLGATMLRREAMARFDERWRALEDVEWWWRTAQRHPVTTDERVGYLVRIHHGVRSGNGLGARVSESLAFIDEQSVWFAAHPRAKAFRLCRAGLLALASGEPAQAQALFLSSCRARPSLRALRHLGRATVARWALTTPPSQRRRFGRRPPSDGHVGSRG